MSERLTVLEERLAAAAAGEFIPVEVTADDALAAVELGVNIVMQDLNDEVERAKSSEAELLATTGELRERLDEITRQNQLIQRQRQTILELSTPVLQLWSHVVAMPIIGILDTDRADQVADRLLTSIHAGDIRFAILDLTGLDLVDSSTAEQLTRVVRAAQLLGVRCVITGIQPEVAQTLVGLGVELSTLHTYRSLEHGLVACLEIMFSERAPLRRERS